MTYMVFENLSQPFSGNEVVRHGSIVVKTGPTIKNEYKWFQAYVDKKDIPTIYDCVRLCDIISITMDYIDKVGNVSILDVYKIVEKYKDYAVIGQAGFQEYRNRIADHLNKNPINNGRKLLRMLEQIDLYPTFSHGDLSIRNIIPSAKGLKLIDPLYGDGRFGSYIIDYAKLAFTLKFFDNNVSDFNQLNTMVSGIPPVLIASECVRVATYNKRFNFISENLIAEL